MGDISEIRGLIVVISFIGSLVFLIGLIPPEFLVAEYEGRKYTIPEYFEALDIQFFAETWNTTLDDQDAVWGLYPTIGYAWFKDCDIGGRDLGFYYSNANASNKKINMKHFWSEWIIIPYWHSLDWVNSQGINREELLDESELNEDYSGGVFEYTAKCSHFQIRAYFGFNETLYSSPSEAWDYYDLTILIGIDFDQVSTGMNAWALIGMLLFFQVPEIHWTLNALIAIPIWVAIVYLSYILILRALGAIFGGGGA